MKKYLKQERWSPYLVGALIGCLLTFLVAFGYQLGVSSGIARIGALVEYAVNPDHTLKTPYFATLLANQIVFDWKILFILSLPLGVYIASRLSGSAAEQPPLIWNRAFGPSKLKRSILAFLGGAILLFGARVANGCTSGHAISGGSFLSVTSWLFMLSLFATAIPTAKLLYSTRRVK